MIRANQLAISNCFAIARRRNSAGGDVASMTRKKRHRRLLSIKCRNSFTLTNSHSDPVRSPIYLPLNLLLEAVNHRDPEPPDENKMPFYVELCILFRACHL